MIMHLLFLRKKEVAFSTFFPFNTKHKQSIQEYLKECLLQEKQKERRVGDSNDNM
jgi:hypothetical protein